MDLVKLGSALLVSNHILLEEAREAGLPITEVYREPYVTRYGQAVMCAN